MKSSSLFCLALTLTTPLAASSMLYDDSGQPFALDPVIVDARVPKPEPLPLLPASVAIDADTARATVNGVDSEDAVKYLPSLFLRKRNYGDTQAVMGSRIWGVSSSARSLVYVDGTLLSALIANNNTLGGPRWGLVAPAEIDRIEVMHGPFSAAYPGNSMGAVLEITTRTPPDSAAAVSQTEAWQSFHQFGTEATFPTHQTEFWASRRAGQFSVWINGSHQDSRSQPLSYVTATAAPPGTSGSFATRSKFGAPLAVLGSGGLLHTRMTHGKVKLGYAVTPEVSASYSYGFWRNDGDGRVETYLRDAAGQPTFAGQSGFASGTSRFEQRHSSHALSVRWRVQPGVRAEASFSRYHFDRDVQSSPSTASATGTHLGSAGRVASLTGTGWANLDLRLSIDPGVLVAHHGFDVGAHADRTSLVNPTDFTTDWQTLARTGTVATEGDGRTRTRALWAQDRWDLRQNLRVTAGLRWEDFLASDGYNVNGTTAVRQPVVAATALSPKLRAEWTPAALWKVTAAAGQAHRFPTPAELYQLVSTGTTYTSPKPDLKPDRVLATELTVQRQVRSGEVGVTLFRHDIRDAITAQYLPLVAGSPTVYSYLSNVDRIRAQGVEFTVRQPDFLVRGLEWSASATYVDARIREISGRANADPAAPLPMGRHLPNIPARRATVLLTYRPTPDWSVALGGRYSDMMYTTLDNADVHPNTYQGFGSWFVADVRVTGQLGRHATLSLGVDNLLNREYFLFHPFPQRTGVVQLEWAY